MAANPHRGSVEFEIEGKTYTLRYSINAICVLEERAGRTLLQLAEDLKDITTLRMATIRDVLYAGLIEHHPEITVAAAGELIIAAGGAIKVVAKFSDAMAAAYPAPEAKESRRPRRRASK